MRINKHFFILVFKFILIPLSLYFFIFLLYGSEYVFDIYNTYQNPGYDQDASSFIKHSWAENIKNGTFIRFTQNVQYPMGWSMIDIPYGSIIDYLVIYPAGWVSNTTIYFWHNIGVIFIYLSAPLFAFYLAYYISKHYIGSLIAGYIFAFSGLNLWYAGGNDPLAHFQFISLYFLSLIYYLDKKSKISLFLVIVTSALNTVTNIYWGWFLYIITGFICAIDYFIFKRYFRSFIQTSVFLLLFVIGSLIISVIANLNFFYYSFKYLDPEISGAANRSIENVSYLPNPIDRYFLPLSSSLWSNTQNESGDYYAEYIPLVFIFLVIMLLLQAHTIPKREKWYLYICIILIGLSILLASTYLQYPLRLVMPSITAYSRLSIVISLFFGIIVSLFFSRFLINRSKKGYIVFAGVLLLLIIDTVNVKAFYTTNFKNDLPPFVSELAKEDNKQASLLIYPLSCEGNGFEHLLFQTFHDIPIAGPYFPKNNSLEMDICKEVSNPYNPTLREYISLFNVGYIVGFPKVEGKVDLKRLERNISPCVSSKDSYTLSGREYHSFHKYFTAKIYRISDECLREQQLNDHKITNESILHIVKTGREVQTLRNSEKSSKLFFEKYASPDDKYLNSVEVEPVKFSYKKISPTEYNIRIDGNVQTEQIFYFNTPIIKRNGWSLYEVNTLDEKFSFLQMKQEVAAKFFPTNLSKLSLYSDEFVKGKSYKIVFRTKHIDTLLFTISTVFILIISTMSILLFIYSLISKTKGRKVLNKK